MKRLMQGMKINWEGNPVSVQKAASPSARASSSNKAYSTRQIFQETSTSLTVTGAMIRKWVAQLVIAPKRPIKETSTVKVEAAASASSSASFGEIVPTGGFGSESGGGGKRRKTMQSKTLSRAEVAFRNRMAAEQNREKVYFLGKFDTEADARAVLDIVRVSLQQSRSATHHCALLLWHTG